MFYSSRRPRALFVAIKLKGKSLSVGSGEADDY